MFCTIQPQIVWNILRYSNPIISVYDLRKLGIFKSPPPPSVRRSENKKDDYYELAWSFFCGYV